ncbi:MAG: DNA-3-methyladenine glycosylase [Dehalococcoidia bacterium]
MPPTPRRRKLTYDAEKARKHLLRADPVMRDIVRRVGPLGIERRAGAYQSLMRALLYQQLAGAAASAIEKRFLALFGDRQPDPDELLATSPEELRAVGISRQKASYLHSLAEHATNGGLNDRRLARAPEEAVIEAVTEIRGVGRWTADMLLMFSLGRPDVLPVGDLGIQRMMMEAYGLAAMPDAETMTKVAEPWRPFRSAASWYLWRFGDVITADVTL